MAITGFLTTPIMQEIILPFILLFTLFFAILEKTSILGSNVRTINSIVSLVLSLLFVGFEGPRQAIVQLVPVIAILLVVSLALMLVFGFTEISSGKGISKGLKITLGIIFGLVILIATMSYTGIFAFLKTIKMSPEAITNTIIIIVIIAAMSVVLSAGGKKKQ